MVSCRTGEAAVGAGSSGGGFVVPDGGGEREESLLGLGSTATRVNSSVSLCWGDPDRWSFRCPLWGVEP